MPELGLVVGLIAAEPRKPGEAADRAGLGDGRDHPVDRHDHGTQAERGPGVAADGGKRAVQDLARANRPQRDHPGLGRGRPRARRVTVGPWWPRQPRLGVGRRLLAISPRWSRWPVGTGQRRRARPGQTALQTLQPPVARGNRSAAGRRRAGTTAGSGPPGRAAQLPPDRSIRGVRPLRQSLLLPPSVRTILACDPFARYAQTEELRPALSLHRVAAQPRRRRAAVTVATFMIPATGRPQKRGQLIQFWAWGPPGCPAPVTPRAAERRPAFALWPPHARSRGTIGP